MAACSAFSVWSGRLAGGADGHAIQPRAGGIATADGRRPAGECEEGLLEGVVGIGRVAERPTADTEDERAVPADEFGKGVRVTGAAEPVEELAVGQEPDGRGDGPQVALEDGSERLAAVREALPENAHAEITPITSITGEIMLLALSSPGGAVSNLELRAFAEFELRNKLLAVPGIAQVHAIGGELPEYQINIRQDRLALFGLTVGIAAQLTGWLDVSRPGTWRITLVFVAHQLVVLASVALRAAWYARALRLTATTP